MGYRKSRRQFSSGYYEEIPFEGYFTFDGGKSFYDRKVFAEVCRHGNKSSLLARGHGDLDEDKSGIRLQEYEADGDLSGQDSDGDFRLDMGGGIC